MMTALPFSLLRCGVVAAVLAATLAYAALPPLPGDANTNHRLGINLSGPADWNAELPFVDVFRLSREWISQQQGAAWGAGPALHLDDHGWIRKLEKDCWAETPILTVDKAPLGDYVLLYDGEGTFEYWPDANVDVVDQTPGRAVVEIKKPGLFFREKTTNPANPLRNIRLLMPGTEKTYQTQPFRQGFLDMWKGMNTYRFMDWGCTNGSTVAHWADRAHVDDMTWTTDKGIPLEVMIDLCNRMGVNPWICIPAHADDDYVKQCATLVRDTLDPTLHVYLEYSNEVWNSGFEQNQYAQAQGKALGIGPAERPWEGGGMYYARRSVEIFRIWEAVFGGHQRFVRVLAWQAANPWWSENIVLPYQDAYKSADALAIAPYMTMCISPTDKPTSDEVAGWSVPQVLDYVEKTVLPQSVSWIHDQKVIADKYHLRLIAYEGGQHLVGIQGGENNDKLTALFEAANRDPRMGDIYQKYYSAWVANGGDLMCTFASIGSWSKWGSWGLAETYDARPEDNPKLKATLDWMAANPLDNAAPVITLPDTLTATVNTPLPLPATVTDDGKSRMAVLTHWSSDTPDDVTFANANTAQTTATFAKAGTYHLTLLAADGYARAEKIVTVVVM